MLVECEHSTLRQNGVSTFMNTKKTNPKSKKTIVGAKYRQRSGAIAVQVNID